MWQLTGPRGWSEIGPVSWRREGADVPSFFQFVHDQVTSAFGLCRNVGLNVADEIPVFGRVGKACLDQVIEIARNHVAFQDLIESAEFVFHRCQDFFRFLRESEFHKEKYVEPQGMRIYVGVVAGDDFFAFQAPHAFGARRGGESDLRCKIGHGGAAIPLQDFENSSIDWVEVAHYAGLFRCS